MIFFSEVNECMKTHHVVIGQYLGIASLTIISIIGALGISLFPYEYIGILGIVPIYLGIKAYVDYKRESKGKENIENQESKAGEKTNLKEVIQGEIKPQKLSSNSFINSGIIKVFSVTIANGGDNIGIYIPLFARMDLVSIIVTVMIFMFLIGIWCFIALRLSKHPLIQNFIGNYKNIFVPIIFIVLGVFILMDSGILGFIYEIIF